MAFKKSYWAEFFPALPRWPCPTCGDGSLSGIKGKEFVQETGPSKAQHREDWFEPEHAELRFSTPMECQVCGELVIVSGDMSQELEFGYDHNGDETHQLVHFYHPKTFYPSPSIISLPEKTPETVAQEIARASALVWLDIGSCSNRLRTAAEYLLTDLGIARYRRAKGPLRPLNLNTRIDRLQQDHAEPGRLLHSIRVLGNVGSHNLLRNIDRNDVLDAFEIFEHVLELLYDDKRKRIAKTASDIRKRKGQKRKPKKV